MNDDDIIYYENRAALQLELAQRASHPAVVKAHCSLADAYLERIYVIAAVASFEQENQLH